MRGLKKDRTNKFDYYLRVCKKCGEVFKSPTKKCRLCEICKQASNISKINNSLKARGIKTKFIGEIKNDNKRVGVEPINTC